LKFSKERRTRSRSKVNLGFDEKKGRKSRWVIYYLIRLKTSLTRKVQDIVNL